MISGGAELGSARRGRAGSGLANNSGPEVKRAHFRLPHGGTFKLMRSMVWPKKPFHAGLSPRFYNRPQGAHFWRGGARPGWARPGQAGRGNTSAPRTGHIFGTDGLGTAGHGGARQHVRRYATCIFSARQGVDWRGGAWRGAATTTGPRTDHIFGGARFGVAWHGEVRQGKANNDWPGESGQLLTP
jgi:hypothetical protein